MNKLDLKSILIGFLGAFVILLSINATKLKTTENSIYEFSDKGEKDVLRFNKFTGEIESVKVRDESVRESLDLYTPGYLDIRTH
tara:strand:- start:2800 stop:3051 length:252 start_codon:yes stop_codon:yes gene_type:complete